jgi:hypothetical protein
LLNFGGFLYTYLAYHGTSREAAQKIMSSGKFNILEGDPCFLGTGAYFFEAGPKHALKWADRRQEKEGGEAAVVEAVIKASVVLNLCDRKYWGLVSDTYNQLRLTGEIPKQLGPEGLFDPETRSALGFGKNYCDHKVMNHVIERINESREEEGQGNIEVVRCPFVRGGQPYSNSWYFKGSCIMLSIRDSSCIDQLRVIY